MDKLKVLLQKLGIELTADQTKQITEVIEKEFVPAADVAANKTKLDELTKQLAARDKDLAKLKADNKSEELQKQLDELNAKYKQDTDDLNAKLSAQQADFAAEKLFGGYKFASDRVRKSVLDEFKGKGFKLENGEFVGGKEYLEGLKQSEPSVFAAEQKPGLFMGSTQSNVSASANNLEEQIFAGIGVKEDTTMAINTIEAAKIFQTALDLQMIQGATSGWMEDNAGQTKYSGGAEVKIPKMSLSGLGKYNRDSGYVQGAVTYSYETKTLTQDRGRKFLLDKMDVDETNFVASASAVMSEFQRTKVIPEVDAYRYSRIYALAKDNYGRTYTPAASTILSTLSADITAAQDATGADDLVIIMPITVSDMLNNSEKMTKYINAGDFKQGNLDLKVRYFNGIPIIPVPSARMKTAYTFNDGTTGGQEAGGFTPAAKATQINWIICPKSAPIAVSKTDNFKIIDPDANQSADAWLIAYRKFHDLWIKDNMLPSIRVCAVAET